MQNNRISLIISKIKNIIQTKIKSFERETTQETDFVEQRKYVGNIIISVLTERIDVKNALLLFPKGCEDGSIRAAWHALCHYEADEDIKKKDIEFNNQQIELLEMIAFEFKDGNPLPQNIIEAYVPYYKNNPISYEKGLSGIIKKLLRIINLS